MEMGRRIEKVRPDWNHWDLDAWRDRPLPGRVYEAAAETTGEGFEIRFLEDVLARRGEDADVLALLGHLYTAAGRYREGLSVDQRLVALKPRDPLAHYNLACSYSLLKQTSRAFAALKKAVNCGYRDVDYMQQDPDLENLRRDPRWDDLLNVVQG
jgi:tetratricopeptide (TPR) repeat protein